MLERGGTLSALLPGAKLMLLASDSGAETAGQAAAREAAGAKAAAVASRVASQQQQQKAGGSGSGAAAAGMQCWWADERSVYGWVVWVGEEGILLLQDLMLGSNSKRPCLLAQPARVTLLRTHMHARTRTGKGGAVATATACLAQRAAGWAKTGVVALRGEGLAERAFYFPIGLVAIAARGF